MGEKGGLTAPPAGSWPCFEETRVAMDGGELGVPKFRGCLQPLGGKRWKRNKQGEEGEELEKVAPENQATAIIGLSLKKRESLSGKRTNDRYSPTSATATKHASL